ncbi:MAG: tetratricopeptide repeat protein [Nitrospirae bacterium]|nr:tetratricopeptide repeat protein [Nitrospirota bacterium]
MNRRNILQFIIFLIFLTIVPSVYSEVTDVHFLRGRTYLLEGNEVDALKEFDKAVEINKAVKEKLSSEYYNAGIVLIKDPKKAHIGLHYLINYLIENKKKGPEIAVLLHTEGLNMISSNKYIAHIMLKKVLELKPELGKDEGFYLDYDVRSANKPDDVIKGGEDFVVRFPRSSFVPEVLYMIGDAHYNLQNPQEGRKYFKEAADTFPDTEWGKKAAKRLKN